MKRFLYNQLKNWKDSKTRKPLILEGARQVGKTWLLKQFGLSRGLSPFACLFCTAATMKWTRDTEGGGAVAALGRNGVIAEPGAARFFATAKNGPEKKHSAYRKKISFALYLRHEHF